jgi:hypothetical protein
MNGPRSLEAQVVFDGPLLMLADGEAGLVGHERFAHPVHRGRPRELADLVGVAVDGLHVFGFGRDPSAVQVELGEAAGVERPRSLRGAGSCVGR